MLTLGKLLHRIQIIEEDLPFFPEVFLYFYFKFSKVGWGERPV